MWIVWRCYNVEEEPRVVSRFGAMMTACAEVLGKRWVEAWFWNEALDVRVGLQG